MNNKILNVLIVLLLMVSSTIATDSIDSIGIVPDYKGLKGETLIESTDSLIKYNFYTDVSLKLKYKTDCDILSSDEVIIKESKLELKCTPGEHQLSIIGYTINYKYTLDVKIIVKDNTIILPPIEPPIIPPVVIEPIRTGHHHKKVLPVIKEVDYSNKVAILYVDREGNILKIEYISKIPTIKVTLDSNGVIVNYEEINY